MMGSGVLFTLMAILVRSAPNIDCYTTALFRFAIGIALLGTAAMTKKITLTFHQSRLLFLRGFLGSIGVIIFYISITHIGLAKGSAITYSYPVFATLGGALFLGERIGWRRGGTNPWAGNEFRLCPLFWRRAVLRDFVPPDGGGVKRYDTAG